MKIIEAMKAIKELQRKAEDLRGKIKDNCVNLDIETTRYEEPKEKVRGWLQAHKDLVREIEMLRLGIQKTNLATMVPIELGGEIVTKCIAGWIHRRKDLAKLEAAAWNALVDKGLPATQTFKQSDGEQREIKLIRHYNQEDKDRMLDVLNSEIALIDGRLEVVNAITDLV